MVRSISRIIILISFPVIAIGCARMSGGIAPSNVPIDGRSYRVLGESKVTDTRIALIGFPMGLDNMPGLIPVSGSNNIREALDEAIASKGADALIDITVETYCQNWILFTRIVTVVQGQAIKFEHPLASRAHPAYYPPPPQHQYQQPPPQHQYQQPPPQNIQQPPTQ